MSPRYFKETERSLRVDIMPALGAARPLGAVTRRHIREALGAMVARDCAPAADHALRYVRALLGWAVREELITDNPALRIPSPDPRKPQDRERSRHLGAEEIPSFWRACEECGPVFGPYLRLLLLTAARRTELAHATWQEIDLDRRIWTLPAARSKNRQEHLIHLSPLAVELLEALPRMAGCPFVFSTTGTAPIGNFGQTAARLRAVMPDVSHFGLHDLRRSAATLMAEDLRVAPHVVDKILNHVNGTIRGVAAIYNKSQYLPERAAALDALGRYIESLVRPTTPNIVELAAAR